MSFFNYIERKLKPVPHKLPEPNFDDEKYNQFNRLRMRCPPTDEYNNTSSFMVRRSFQDDDQEMSKQREGLVKVSAEIFRYRFLSCFEQIDNESVYLQGRIIITDSSSWSMIDRALDWFTLKRSGVSCIFPLTDKISIELT